MTTLEIKNKGEKALWSEGFITGNNKKPFFRIDIFTEKEVELYSYSKPFMIFLIGTNFNQEIHKIITEKRFGDYNSKIHTDINSFEWNDPEGYKRCLGSDGFVIEKLVPSTYKSYLYFVSNIDYILNKIIEVESAVFNKIVPALEVIL